LLSLIAAGAWLCRVEKRILVAHCRLYSIRPTTSDCKFLNKPVPGSLFITSPPGSLGPGRQRKTPWSPIPARNSAGVEPSVASPLTDPLAHGTWHGECLPGELALRHLPAHQYRAKAFTPMLEIKSMRDILETFRSLQQMDELEWLISVWLTGTPDSEIDASKLADPTEPIPDAPLEELSERWQKHIFSDPYFQEATKKGGSFRDALGLTCSIQCAIKRLKNHDGITLQQRQRLGRALMDALQYLDMEEAIMDLGLSKSNCPWTATRFVRFTSRPN
jgi:hypothetical protein